MCSDTRLLPVCVPSVLEIRLRQVLLEFVKYLAGRIRRETVFVQQGLGIGDPRQKASHGEAVTANDGPVPAEDTAQIEPVRLEKRARNQILRYLQPHMPQIRGGRKAMLADFVD